MERFNSFSRILAARHSAYWARRTLGYHLVIGVSSVPRAKLAPGNFSFRTRRPRTIPSAFIVSVHHEAKCKPQDPSSRIHRSFKRQAPKLRMFAGWILDLLRSLELGAWSLEPDASVLFGAAGQRYVPGDPR